MSDCQLEECGDKIIADGSLKTFIRRVSTFGLSLMKLDIRQESTRHTEVIDAITRLVTVPILRIEQREGSTVVWLECQISQLGCFQ